ncbi:MAG: diguanylate cyclase [Anaerolineales bacterium]
MAPKNFSELADEFNNLPDEFYKKLIDTIGSGVYLVDRDRRILYWNGTAHQISGYPSEEVISRWCGDGLLKHVDFEGTLLCGDGCPLKATMEDGIARETDVFLKHKDGHRVPVRVKASPVYSREGELIGAVETFIDITPDLAARMEIRKLSIAANTDSLTGVTNRRWGEQVIGDTFLVWERDKNPFGLFFVDVDNLKQINDQFGHDAGDHAIKLVASTLKSLFRKEDLIARWGGDEFVILVGDIDSDLLVKITEKVSLGISTSEMPKEYPGCKLSVSIGGTLVMEGDTPESILARADRIMYQEKKRKKNAG